MVVSKVDNNTTEIMKSANLTNSDINLKSGFVSKYVNMFKIASFSNTGSTFKIT